MADPVVTLKATPALLAAVAAGTFFGAQFGDGVAVNLAFVNGECESGVCTLEYGFVAEAIDEGVKDATNPGVHRVRVNVDEADLRAALQSPDAIAILNIECQQGDCIVTRTPADGDRSKASTAVVAESVLVDGIKGASSANLIEASTDAKSVDVVAEAAEKLPTKK